MLDRNPAWNPASDPLRHAYVDQMDVTEGLTQDNVQQQIEAGTGDMDWDVTPPAQDLPKLNAAKDSRLVIGPSGPYYVALNTYLALNEYAGPMKNKLVRQAANYAVNKNAIVQIYGGPNIAAPANQIVLPGNVGYIKNYNPYPDKNGNGDPAKSKALLAKAGYPNGLPIKLLYSTTDPGPRVAQALQASLTRAASRCRSSRPRSPTSTASTCSNRRPRKRDVWDIAPSRLDPRLVRATTAARSCSRCFSSPGNGLERLRQATTAPSSTAT